MDDINITRILFPCDLTKSAQIVAPYVKSVAKRYHCAVTVLHVVPDVRDWKAMFTPVPSLTVYYEEIRKHAEKQLSAFTRKHFPFCSDSEKVVVAGDPVEIILNTIDTEDIDLIIMGTHGARGLEHRIFGSVAENVIKKSPVPVMVVNPHRLPAISKSLF